MKKLFFYTFAIVFALVSCQNSRNKTVVNELNRQMPINTGAGLILTHAEALPGNGIKMSGSVTDPMFDSMDSATIVSVSRVMKNAIVAQAAQSRALRDIGSNLVYELTTPGGKTFQIEISAEDIKNFDATAEMLDNPGIDEKTKTLNLMLSSTKPTLPAVIDEENRITVVDVYIEGESTFVYVNEIPRENLTSTDPEELKQIMVEAFRHNQSVLGIIKSGIDVKYVYKTPEGEKIAQVLLTCSDFFEDC